jgi:hypothetical protein
VGVKVAVEPEHVTVPVTAAPPSGVTVKVPVVRVEQVTGSLKVALSGAFKATPAAPRAGIVETT